MSAGAVYLRPRFNGDICLPGLSSTTPEVSPLRWRSNVAAPALACLYIGTFLLAIWVSHLPLPRIFASLSLGTVLLSLSAIDLRTFRLPDALTLPLVLAGITVSLLSGNGVLWSISSALLGFAALFGIGLAYRVLRGADGLGLGDAKLLAASGAWLGAEALPAVLLYASSSALLCVAVIILFGHEVGRNTRIPFGPFLALGTWLVWLYGSPIPFA